VTIELTGQRLEDRLPGRQGLLLFVFLVLNRDREVRRAELIGALWPEAGRPAASDSALSALLSKLRGLLGHDMLVGRGELRLVLPPGAWIDLEAAGTALHSAESAVALGDWRRAWAPARIALHTASRGFLLEEDAPWIDEQRRELEEIQLLALECVAQVGLGLGGPELAATVRSGRRLIELAPYRESGYRLLMEGLERQGNAAEALRVYERLRSRLRDELGVAPGAEAQALHRRLLEQSSARP
jgi:SARP family transcriptional regulator, regulator of embCAB operon